MIKKVNLQPEDYDCSHPPNPGWKDCRRDPDLAVPLSERTARLAISPAQDPGSQIKVSTRGPSDNLTRWIWPCRFAWVVSIAMGVGLAQQNTSIPGVNTRGLRHALLRGVTTSQTLEQVNRNDARASLKVWFDIIAQQRGFYPDSSVDIVDSVAEVRERLKSHSVELVTLSISEYLELESGGLLVPVLADVRGGQSGALYSYVLLVRPSAGITTVAGLREKTILVSSRGGSNAGGVWTDVLLGKEKLGRAASFFASFKISNKPQACILPLFFGIVDACVVDEVSLNLAKEMNPQLGQLRILARSPPIVEGLLAVPTEPHPYQKEMIEAMLSLPDDPRGRQVLMVFKTSRLVRIQAGDLEAARELWRDYYRLPGLPARVSPAGSENREGGS